MSLGLVPSYAALCVVQGALVLAPAVPRRITRSWAVGVVVPIAALALGVALVRGFAGGADALTALASTATPLLAAAMGWVRRWRFPWIPVPVAAGLYVLAWQDAKSLGGNAAGVLLIAGACLTIAAVIASLAPARALAVGLVLLVVLDVILVWGDRQVAPTTVALHRVVPPHVVLIPGHHAKPLPALQDATFGSALVGWLDLLAPALLAAVVAGRGRVQAVTAGVTTVAALGWGVLLFLHVTSPIPATVPVLVGLVAAAALGALGPTIRGSRRAPRRADAGRRDARRPAPR